MSRGSADIACGTFTVVTPAKAFLALLSNYDETGESFAAFTTAKSTRDGLSDR